MLRRTQMRRLFERLSMQLEQKGVQGELYLVGGAVMCLAFDARPATRDVDGFFRPATAVREAAKRVAHDAGVGEDWLNDAVKAYLSPHGDFDPWLELPHLRVLTATPEYLLAMKCLAMRIGAEFHDEADVRFLLRYLNLTKYAEALSIIGRYYPLERVPQKTLYALEELLPGASS